MYDLESAGVGADADALRENLAKRYRWLWYVDLERHLEEAMGMLGGEA